MKADLQRLAAAAESLERQVRELREQIEQLVGTERARDPAVPAADDSDARLIAYSMVLDGKPREEVARHLEQELGLSDTGALLDDLYERVDA